jgi:hypothetical protein
MTTAAIRQAGTLRLACDLPEHIAAAAIRLAGQAQIAMQTAHRQDGRLERPRVGVAASKTEREPPS